MTDLFTTIDKAINDIGHGWTTVIKGQTMAAMILALRPAFTVEIGVYAGKGLVSMGLAHKALGYGVAIGIDPYTAEAAVESQVNPEDQKFWGTLDYQNILKLCRGSLSKYHLLEHTRLIIERSETTPIPGKIGLLRIDGNHGEPAVADAQRWAPAVIPGGFVLCDDIGWAGGATTRAADWLKGNGFFELYKLDDGIVFQRL